MDLCFEISELLFENKKLVPDIFYIRLMDLLKNHYYLGTSETKIFNYVISQEGIVDTGLLIEINKVLLKHIKENTKGPVIVKDPVDTKVRNDDLILDYLIITVSMLTFIFNFVF